MKTHEYTLANEAVAPGAPSFSDLLPNHAPMGDIGINVERLNSIAQWGGFYPTVAIRPFAGRVSTATGGFVQRFGSQRDASVLNIMRLGIGEPYEQPHDPAQGRPSDWRMRAPLTLWVNTSELTQRVQQHPGGKIRDPGVWSDYLNQALGEGLRTGARQHLISKPCPKPEKVISAGVGIVNGTLAGIIAMQGVLPQEDLPLLAAVFGAGVTGTVNLARVVSVIDQKGIGFKDACFSVIPVRHYDRLAVVHGLTRAQRLTTKHA